MGTAANCDNGCERLAIWSLIKARSATCSIICTLQRDRIMPDAGGPRVREQERIIRRLQRKPANERGTQKTRNQTARPQRSQYLGSATELDKILPAPVDLEMPFKSVSMHEQSESSKARSDISYNLRHQFRSSHRSVKPHFVSYGRQQR